MRESRYIRFLIKRELKNNILFIALFLVLVFSYSYLLPKEITLFLEKKADYEKTKTQLDLLEGKMSIIKSVNENEIDKALKTFSKVLPLEEDYYSIISTLNKLALISGLSIEKYSVNFDDKNKKNTKITVDTTGDNEKLFNFFKNYFVSSGRLITLDSFEYIPNFSNKSITLNFYHMSNNTIASSYTLEEIHSALRMANAIQSLQFSISNHNEAFEKTNQYEEGLILKIGEKENPFSDEE